MGINAELLTIWSEYKPNGAILNFARDELVDDAALIELFDSGASKGTYITDFTLPQQRNHPNILQMPHLGASTEEAEDNAASMAASTLIDFITNGNVRNSVNFPTAVLDRAPGTSRICVSNSDKAGTLQAILGVVADEDINIVQMVNASAPKTDCAYNLIDTDTALSEASVDALRSLEGVKRVRILAA